MFHYFLLQWQSTSSNSNFTVLETGIVLKSFSKLSFLKKKKKKKNHMNAQLYSQLYYQLNYHCIFILKTRFLISVDA